MFWFAMAAMALSAAASMKQGQEKERAAEVEARLNADEARTANLAGRQREAHRLEELRATLATQEAIRAGRGLDYMSPTGQVIRLETIDAARDDIDVIRLNAANAAARYELAADNASESGRAARTSGILKAGGGLMSFASGGKGVVKVKDD